MVWVGLKNSTRTLMVTSLRTLSGYPQLISMQPEQVIIIIRKWPQLSQTGLRLTHLVAGLVI